MLGVLKGYARAFEDVESVRYQVMSEKWIWHRVNGVENHLDLPENIVYVKQTEWLGRQVNGTQMMLTGDIRAEMVF